jgi:aromatic ring-opening dioxygenase catalytic subunit (LigB family)
MSKLVAALAMSHSPLIPSIPTAPPLEKRERVQAAYDQCRAILEEAKPQAIIIISAEHMSTFSPQLIPPFTLGVASSYTGPLDKWIGIPQKVYKGSQEFSQFILSKLYQNQFDVAMAGELALDHGIIQPLHYVEPREEQVVVIPVVLNGVTPPLPSMKRCYEFGKVLREAIEEQEIFERVAILGTGGLSHWVGTKEMGTVNEEWDRHALDLIQSGRAKEFACMNDEEIIPAGNGAEEVRAWSTVVGAALSNQGRVIAYENVKEWVTGLGFVQMNVKDGARN